MKKKIFGGLIVLIILGIILILGYFKFFKEKSKEYTYLEETLEPSSQSQYLQNSIPKVLKYLDENDLKKEITLDALNIKDKNCNGKISPNNNTYAVSATCKENSSGYNINYILTKGIKIEILQTVSEVTNGYIFVGTNDVNGIIGFLDKMGNIKWQTPVTFKDEGHVSYRAIETEDSYIIFDQVINDNGGSSYMIKLDKSGKVLLYEKIADYPINYVPKYNGSDSFVVPTIKLTDEKMENLIIDKNGKTLNTIETSLIKNIDYSGNNIYYIEKDKLIIVDNKGSKVKSFTLKNIGDVILSLEVINEKILITDLENAFVYNLDGKLLKKYNYSLLSLPSDKFTSERGNPTMFSNIKFNDNVYYNWFLNGYTMVDRYDQNLELFNRKLYKNTIEDIGSANYDTTIMMGEEISNIKYSNTYEMFIKTVYNE